MLGGLDMRGLSIRCINELKSGVLKPLLDRIKKDDTLMLSIRKNYFNIYYRGGNILKVTEQKNKTYEIYFDKKYDFSPKHEVFEKLELPKKASESKHIKKWIDSIPVLKELMDFWLKKYPKLEREFQQLIERENNRSSISNQSEYFITDIEFADSSIGARFDILAVKWPANKRCNGNECVPVFIEVKYSDNTLKGPAGIIKHLEDINKYITDESTYRSIIEVMNLQFNQLDELGLIKFRHASGFSGMKLDTTKKPEVIIVLANHNPRSKRLKRVLKDKRCLEYADSEVFDLKFYVSSNGGYGMHTANMLSYDEYTQQL